MRLPKTLYHSLSSVEGSNLNCMSKDLSVLVVHSLYIDRFIRMFSYNNYLFLFMTVMDVPWRKT